MTASSKEILAKATHGSRSLQEYLDKGQMNDDTSPLLHSEKMMERDYETGKILCIKRPPKWLWRVYQKREIIKIAILVCILIVSVVLFALQPEEESETLHLASVSRQYPLIADIGNGASGIIEAIVSVQAYPESYDFGEDPQIFVNVTIQGRNSPQEPWSIVSSWEIVLETFEQDELIYDFILTDDLQFFSDFRFYIDSNTDLPLGITFLYRLLNATVKYEVLYAALILVGVYILIVFELMHRTIAAMLGSTVCLAVLSTLHARPSFETVVSWIDFETCGLLFGMMVMVGIFSSTGFFEWSAVKAYKLSRSNLWYLTLILCSFTSVVSAFLDNVTTILLLTPVTIRLCKVLDVKPEPVLIAEVIFSNLGGTATIIGDPPNIIIANDPRVHGIEFLNFSVHMAPGVIAAIIVIFIMLYFIFSNIIYRIPPSVGLQREIDIWKKTAASMDHDTSEEGKVVQDQLASFIHSLELELKQQSEADGMAVKEIDIGELESKYRIHDVPLFISSCMVLGSVIFLFFAHNWIEEYFSLSLAWIAIMGSIVHLVVSGIKDIEEVLEKVELGTLLFFAALFILMHGLEELGLVTSIGNVVSDMVSLAPEGKGRLAAAITIIIWVSAIVSAFIDNIPYTTAMVPVVVNLANSNLGLPLSPLIWALSFGTCFGGNGTLIGASANVVAVGLSEQQGYPISFVQFFKLGFPIMLVSVFIANIYLLIFHVWIPWGWDIGTT